MILENHKHCKNCEAIIIPCKDDSILSYKHPTLRSLRFKRDTAYTNCFCEQCIAEYGLIDLCRCYKKPEVK